MTSKRKALRDNHKHLDYKREAGTALRMKVLRSVLAVGVGFTLTPWLSRAAAANPTGNIVRTGTSTNLLVNNVAHIYAEKAHNGVGVNAFERFEVGNNQIANLYFQTKTDTTPLHTLVNTVENQISISGTVNAIRNNKIGGNLYFLSPKGMVVGSTGVINAGSLTMITSSKKFTNALGTLDPDAAAAAIAADNWDVHSNAKIDIHGQINTATGIDLRAAYINVTKDTGATLAPSLKTGVVFANTVNTTDINKQAGNVVSGSRLTATVDSNGNVVIADHNEPNNVALQGNGGVRLAASSTSRNTDTKFLGVTGYKNTAEAKVEVGQGATIDALGNVNINAQAAISDLPELAHFVDMSGYAKADVTIDGSVKGNNVNVNASAQALYSGNNHANLMDLVNNLTGEIGVTVKANLTGTIWNVLDNAGKINGKVDILNKVVNQVYMPFNLSEADATVNIGSNANIKAKKLELNGTSYGGNVNMGATSVSQNVMVVGLQPKVHAGDKDMSQYFVGGFIYEDSTSKAIVNVDGIVGGDKNVNLKAVAQNANSSSISVKAPQVYKVPNPRPDDPYESTMVAVGVNVVNQETTAQVNLGAQNKNASVTAANKLAISATSANSLSSTVAMQNFRDTAVNVAVNVVGSEGSALVNNYAHLQGGAVDISSAHTLNKFSVDSTNKVNIDFVGLDWVINSSQVREGADSLRDFIRGFNQGPQEAAGDNIQAEAEEGPENVGEATPWNDYFDIGATVTVASAANEAKVNLKPTSAITATGDVGINAHVNVADSKIVSLNNFLNSSPNAVAGVSAAVATEFMDNTAEVNMDGSATNAINAGGSVALTATTEQRYNRVQKLVEDLQNAFAATKQYWSSWGSQADLNKKFQNLQNIVTDIAVMASADPTADYKNNPKFVAKAKAGLDIVTSLTGTEGIKKALEAFVDVSNYVNMHVSAGTDAKENKDTTAMVSGAVGVQKLVNNANVNLGANTKITAGNYANVNLSANAVESNVLLVGKMALIPDFTSTYGGQYGLGGTVGVQNAYTNSKVQLMNGVQIDAGSIDIGSVNDVLNLGIVFGGSETSKLGLTGMVSYMGGASKAETLIDDDIDFTARKKIENVPSEENAATTEDKVTSSGVVQISADNKTNVINLVGDWNAAEASSVGASVGVVSYDVRSVAKVTNQELYADGISKETSGAGGTAAQKGSIAANGVAVNAKTDGVVNTFTVAGVNSSKSQNANAAAGGVNVAADGGQAAAAAGGVQNAHINGGAAGGQGAKVKLNAVGSVSWNYVVDTTKATLDNVDITLTPATIGAGVTSPALINDKSGFVRVEAEDASYIGAYSGAMALTKLGNNNHTAFQGALAGAVAVNDVQKTTAATIKNSSITRQTAADVAADVLNYAHNSGAQVAAGLSLGLDVGTCRGGVAINLAGSGSANYVDSTVQAQLESNTIAGGNTVVNNVAYDKDVQVAGGVTVETTKATASVGAAVAVNAVHNDIQANMLHNSIGTATQKAAAVHNIAASNLTQVGTAVSVGVATGDKAYATLNAAVATNTINNAVEASIDGGSAYAAKLSDEAKDGQISLDTAENKYLVELNQASESAVTVDANGNFVKEGVLLERAFAVYANGQKGYKVYTLDENGDYVDGSGKKLTCTILTDASGNTTGLAYTDYQGNTVDINDVQYFAPAASGGTSTPVDINALNTVQKDYFDLDGSGALLEANGTYGADRNASITEGAEQASYTNSAITLTNQGNHIVGVALGLGVKAGNSGLAQGAGTAAVNTNNVTNNFVASVKNAAIGTGESDYENNGSLKEAALRVEAASDTSMVSVAAGVAVTAGGQDKVSLALAGSGAVQKINNTTKVAVENSVVSTDYLSIKGSSASQLVTVAGQVGVETSQKGIAAGFSWAENELDNTVGAYARGLTLNGLGTNATNLQLLAANNSKAWAVSVGTGVALGYVSAEGAYAENHGLNNTEALVEAYQKPEGGVQNNTITNAKDIFVQAEDNTVEKAVAGTASVSLKYAALGGAAANNQLGNSADDKQRVRALLSAATITTADNGAVHVLANNNADYFTLALGAAVRAAGSGYIGVGAEGDAALTQLYTATEAGLDKVNISTTAANKALVEVSSKSDSSITSSADALSVSASGSGAQIGFSTSVSKVHSDADTITSITESSIDAEDILAKSNSQNEILDVAIGLSVGVGQYAGVALAGNIASNIIDNDTSIDINNSTLKAHDTLAVLASSNEKLENYGGGLSVGVGTSAAGVAIGATVVTNTITSDTDAIIDGSDLVALGVGDGIKIAEHKSVATTSSKADPDPVDDYAKYALQETSAANANAKKGLVVNAEAEHVLRDISITGGVAVGSAAGVAVDATVVINSITGSTSAQVNSTDINNTSEALANANVYVNAFDKADISSHLDTLSVGAAGEGAGVGAAGAGDRNTVQRNTVARIVGKADGTTVLNGNSVAVDALGYTKLHLSETGLAAGASAIAGAAVTGAVSVNRFAGNTTALVSNVKGTVHELAVNAERLTDMQAYNNAISLSGGIVGASVSVGVTDVEDTSHTNAELSKAVLTADGAANSKVEVKAQNNTQLGTELSADSLEISLGESWGIAVSNVNMEAQVGAKLNEVTLGSAEQEFGTVTVEANNNTYSKFQNVAVAAGSVLGVGVGHGVLNINTGTAAEVLQSSAFANAINVHAYEKRTVATQMVGVGVGALYIGVNTMHTNIGTNLQDSYTYDDGVQSYNTSDFQAMVNGSLERMNSQAASARGKTGDTSIQLGASSINTGHAEQGGVSNTIASSNLIASVALQAEAKATTNTDIDIYQATVAIVNVGVPAARTTVEDKLNVNIQNATLQGKAIAINSTTDGEIKSFAGQGGVSGASYVDTTAYVKHLGQNSISIDGSMLTVVDALSDAVNPLSIHALNQTQLNNRAFGMNISILKGGRMVLEGEDSTEVAIALGANEQISAENSFTSSKQVEGSSQQSEISILAENAAVVKDEIILNETIGGIAAGGSVVASKAKGKAAVNVSDKNAFTAQAVDIEALTGGTKDAYTTEAINHSVGVAAGAINVDKVRTYNAMQATTSVGAIKITDGAAALTVGATNAATSNAYIHSVNVGLGLASGNNFAQSHASGQAITTVNAGTSGISTGSLNIFAANSDDIVAKADGSNAGIMDISPYAAEVENTVASATTVNLSGVFKAEEGFSAQALRKDKENFKADALSVTAFGGGDARVDSAITANTQLNANGATIVSGGDTILAAENTVELNQKDGFNKMVLGQGYGILEVSTCGIENTIDSTAHVDLNNSGITSAGSLQTKAHTEEQLQVNAYAYSVGAFEGAEVKVKNNITNDEEIKLQNTSFKTSKAYHDITLAAADDLKLFTYSYAESPAGALGGANAIVNNTLIRDNSIDVLGGSSLYSSQDINLYAGKNVDGSVATLDFDVEAKDFVGAIIPIPVYPSINNNIQQHNQINLDTNSASTSVRHSNLYAAAGREMANLSAARYVGFYGSSQKGSFVTTDNGETIAGKTADNYVNINGKLIAGVANEIGITIGAAGDIVILDDDMRACVEGAKDANALAVTINADASTGLSKASLTFASEDYANTLLNRYNELLDLMSEYGKDDTVDTQAGTVTHTAAYLGYKAETDRIKQEMLDMGLVTVSASGTLIPKDTLNVDYVEIPELTASGGNITVETDSLLGSASATMKAQGTPAITVTNNTNLLTKVNAVTVDDPGGKFVYNGTSITGADTAAINSSIDALNKTKGAAFGLVEAADGEYGKIEIKGLYNGNSINYSGSFVDEQGQTQPVSGSIKPIANVQIQGNIYAKDGSVKIYSKADSILIQGKNVQDAVGISAASITLEAAQSITQGYTDGIVNIGGDVRQLYDSQYQSIIDQYGAGGSTQPTYPVTSEMTQLGSAPAEGSKGSGSYIAGGSIYINASDINVNGIIQSGFGDYYADISNLSTQSKISQINKNYIGGAISDSVITSGDRYKIIDGGAYWDDTAKCYKYRLNVYYNPSTQKILVQNVDAGGGKIYLTGRISSTGNGKIICLDGVSDINVNNTTKYDLQLGDLVTHDVQGLVSITDTAKNTLTEITSSTVTVKNIDDKGKVSATGTSTTFDPTKGYDYAPQTGLRYTWTSGVENTTFDRYKKDVEDGGWGLWGEGVSTEQIAEWHKQNPIPPIEPGQSYNGPRNSGETIRVATGTEAYNNYVTVSSKQLNTDTVKESERWYSSGLWGYHKHYEVIWTESTGTLYTYDAVVKADNTFNINFVGHAADNASVTVSSLNNIELNGNIGNTQLYENTTNGVTTRTEKGTVSISSQKGSLLQNGGGIYAADVYLEAAKDMQGMTIVAGDTVNLNAINLMESQNDGAQHSIDISIKAAGLAKGNVVLGNVGSVTTGAGGSSMPINDKGEKTTGVTGLVNIATRGVEGNITQADDSLIVSDRIDLSTTNGSIYGQKQADGSITALQLYAGQQPTGADTLSASVNASAKGDIAIEQLDGNLRVGRIYSAAGDVSLTISQGSVEDALPYVAYNGGDADAALAKWRLLGIIEGDSTDKENAEMLAAKNFQNSSAEQDAYEAWDAYALLYAIQDSIVNPVTSALPDTSEKDPNVIGHNITITVADSVGINMNTPQRIDMDTLLAKDSSGNYLNLDKLKALSKLDASTKVEFETDSGSGHTYAVYTETLPIGVQQTLRPDGNGNLVSGKLTAQSSATNTNSGTSGDIYLQGREQLSANESSTVLTNNKDLYIGKLATQVGDIVLTSLGGIYNAANANTPAITGRSLALTAAGASIGTSSSGLTIDIFGADKSKDGLRAIASGGIYVDQKGSNALLVHNVSSGGDIYLGSDTSIFMGVVNGSNVENYIRAENDGAIVLEARNGSIGEVEYVKDAEGNYVRDAAGNMVVARDTNNGVRILNSAASNTSHVALRASDSVYVTGVASEDGVIAAPQGPAGTLNLTVEGVTSSGQAATLRNVGVSVDGELCLETPVVATATVSVYTAGDFALNNNMSITSPDTYLGSGRDLLAENAQSIVGTERLTLEAANDIVLKSGAFSGRLISLDAAGHVDLQGASLQATEKAYLEADGNILLKSGSLTAKSVDMLAVGYVDEAYDNSSENGTGYALSVSDTLQVLTSGTNTADGKDYGIDLGSRFNQLHKVELYTGNGNVILGNGNTGDITLDVIIGDINKPLSGNIDIHNYNNLAEGEQGNDITVSGLLKADGIINITNEESDIHVLEAAGAEINGSQVTLHAAASINNDNNITSSSSVDLQASKSILNDGDITAATDVTMRTKNGSMLNTGNIDAEGKVTANSGSSIINLGGNIQAAGEVRLNAADTLWNLAQVTSTNGDVILEAGNGVANTTEYGDYTGRGVVKAAGNVTISTNNSTSTAALLGVYNDADIEAAGDVTINSNKNLENKGHITADNTITMVAQNNISQSGDVVGEHIAINAGNDVEQSNGMVKATGTTADYAITVTAGKDITLTYGSMVAQTASLTAAAGTMQQVTNADLIGHAVEVQSLTVKAGKGVSLASKENKLEQVYLDVAGGQNAGGILIGNGNTGDTDLRIAIKTGSTLADDITIRNYNNLAAGEHGNDILVDGNLQTSGNITLINDESDIVVTGDNAVLGRDVSFDAAGNIYNEHSIEAKNTASLTAKKNILNAGGEIKAATKVTLNAGEILWNLASITSTNSDVELIAGQAVLNTTSSSAEKPEGAPANAAGTITAANGSVTISTTKLLADDVLGGVYNNATITALDSVIINSNDDAYNTGSITATAGESIVKISAEKNLSNKGDITAHQISATVGQELQQTNGNIVAENGVVSLLAHGDVKIDNGSVIANGGLVQVNGTGNVYINNGDVTANTGTINVIAGQNIEQINGSLGTETGEVKLTAGQNIILTDGALTAKEASLTAINGYIKQNYDNSLDTINGYDIKIIDDLSLKAGNGGTAAVETAIDLGSKFNELKDVVLEATNGDIVVGSGRSTEGELSITVANNQIVDGNILFQNYANGAGNDINVDGLLMATGKVTILNEEANITNKGTILTKQEVLLHTLNGNITNENIITSEDSTVTLIADKDDAVAGNSDVGNIHNGLGDVFVTNADITAAKGISLQAAGTILNVGDYLVTDVGYITVQAVGSIANIGDYTLAKDGDITVRAGVDVGNTGRYIITENGNITVSAGRDIANLGSYYTHKGNMSMTATKNLLNFDFMETESGNISIISTDGIIFNKGGADLLTGDGNVTLRAESQNGYYYYFDAKGELKTLPAGTTISKNDKGEYVAQIGNGNNLVVKNGSVFNAGDILALGGTITLESAQGNLNNYDDFNTLSVANSDTPSVSYKDKNIATGNIVFSAENGHLYNNKDLESGESISLTAAEGLTNFAYNVYAGKDITLTATQGNVVNTAVLESVYGDVKLVAEHGNVVNGIENQPSSGDIVTLGGKVILEARGVDGSGNGYNATNYGDIIAIGKMTNDVEGSGSIILKSENGNVYNYDDFNTLNDTTEINYNYEASKHISIVTTNAGYNIATSNITLSAVEGEIINTKDYLVALGNVTLEAQKGIGSYGDVILAGGDITLSDTDGDLVNRAKLVSVDGNITLNAENGTVINMLDGDVVALNGNVTLHAGADYDDQVKYVGINGNTVVEGTVASVPEGRIIVTKKYYVLNGQETEMVNDVTVPQNATVKTVIGYLNEANNDTFVAVETVGYDVEAYRMGDVVNRGDLVALNPNNVDGKGSVSLVTDHGNATNYDNFKLVDGAEQFAYLGKSGYAVGSNTAKFNEGTKYYYDKGMVLSDADLAMKAENGYLYNTMNMHSEKSLTLISGKDLTVGTNFAAIDAVGDVTLQSTEGTLKVKDGSSVTSTTGSISMDGKTGIINSNSAAITAAEDVAMTSAAGAIENDSTVKAINGSVEMKGNNGITNNDGAAITAGQNVVMASEAGEITNASSVTAQKGSIVLDSQGTEAINGGITSNAAGSGLSALNGSISAVVKYGEINISELIAKDTAAAGTQSGNVTLGNIKGDDVVLYTESASSDITVNNIIVGDHLLLQGNSFKHTDAAGNIVSGVGTITRSSNEGTLIVDVSGVGEAGGNGTMKSDFGMQVEGDVRFTTMNVTNANVSIGGTLSIDKLHVGGEAHFDSQGYVTGVYGGGTTPYHDSSNALYYDLSDGSANTGLNMRVTADEFRAVREGEQAEMRALATMKELKARLQQAGSAPDTFGQGMSNNAWMNLYVDTSNYQRSNGLLLHIDTGYRSANQRWSAEDLSGKLVDFKSHDSFVAHYGNMASFFDRFDLLEQTARPMSEVLHTANKEKVVLQQDNNGLRIEEKAEATKE